VLADDSADMRAYVTGLLEPRFDVVAVGDGAAALLEIRTRIPDLVLCDITMPEVNGFELLAALRADPETRTLPVIMLSARAGLDASEAGLDAGADDYLVKPFSARELIARVRTHVALQQTRRAWISQLEGANCELVAFSDSVSHDLRAPLRVIGNFSDILLDNHPEDLTVIALHCAERIRASALRMRELIDDLLALSKAGRCALHKSSIDLTVIAREVVSELRAETPERIVDIDVAEGLNAVCDGRLMTIVLRNLLANAWKFTGNRAHAAISVGSEDGEVFFVRDNGVGFDAVNASRLFEPFQRLHTEEEFAGTGIGLALVHRIIERHGGRVWAQGAVGSGATMRFTLEPNGHGGWRSTSETPLRPREVSKPD
jgi:signal transduction histidine kinase